LTRTLNRKPTKEVLMKCYKVMAVHVLMYSTEAWVLRKAEYYKNKSYRNEIVIIYNMMLNTGWIQKPERIAYIFY
jgi:hypothetical protein